MRVKAERHIAVDAALQITPVRRRALSERWSGTLTALRLSLGAKRAA